MRCGDGRANEPPDDLPPRTGGAYNGFGSDATHNRPAMTTVQPLASGFPNATESDWHAAVLEARRSPKAPGAPREEPRLPPRRAGARALAGRTTDPWLIVERIDSGGAAEAALQASTALAGGATGLDIVLGSSLHPLHRRLDASPAEIASALAGIIPEGIQVRVDAGDARPSALAPFLDLAAQRRCELVWSFDPAAAAAIRSFKSDSDAIRSAGAAFATRNIAGAAVVADGRLWHAGGATEEQELGIVVATFAAHVRLLNAADRIGVILAADTDQFRTIAKFRAIRLLLARVIEVGGLAAPPPRVHAETAWRTLATRDADTNILRATSAAFGAVVGGADSMTVLPFDSAGRDDAGLARRLARNTQLILADEANVHRVADPAAGSGAIEALTALLAEAAWKRFQAIEAEGGILAAIAEGSLLRDVAEAREARLARVARADIPLIGVNAFRGEVATATIKRALVKRTGPLTFKRLAEPFEANA